MCALSCVYVKNERNLTLKFFVGSIRQISQKEEFFITTEIFENFRIFRIFQGALRHFSIQEEFFITTEIFENFTAFQANKTSLKEVWDCNFNRLKLKSKLQSPITSSIVLRSSVAVTFAGPCHLHCIVHSCYMDSSFTSIPSQAKRLRVFKTRGLSTKICLTVCPCRPKSCLHFVCSCRVVSCRTEFIRTIYFSMSSCSIAMTTW